MLDREGWPIEPSILYWRRVWAEGTEEWGPVRGRNGIIASSRKVASDNGQLSKWSREMWRLRGAVNPFNPKTYVYHSTTYFTESNGKELPLHENCEQVDVAWGHHILGVEVPIMVRKQVSMGATFGTTGKTR